MEKRGKEETGRERDGRAASAAVALALDRLGSISRLFQLLTV